MEGGVRKGVEMMPGEFNSKEKRGGEGVEGVVGVST